MRKFVIAFFATGVVLVLNFVSGVLIARVLGPVGRGEVSEIIAWFAFISSITIMGINDATTYFLAKDDRRPSDVISAALGLSVGTIALGLGIGLVASLTALRGLDPRAIWAAFLLFVPLSHLVYLFISYLQSSRDEVSFNILRSLQGIIYVSSLIVLGITGATGTFPVICAYLGGFLVSAVFGLVCYRRRGGRFVRPPAGLRLGMFKFGSPLVMQRFASVCRDNLDKMVLPLFAGTAAFGHYVVASSVVYLIFIIGMTVELVGFPILVRAASDEERRRDAETLVALTFWMLCGAAIVLIVARQTIIHFIFGSRYDVSASLVPGFVLAGALQAFRLVLGTAFKGFGRSKALAGIEFVSAVTMVVILFGGVRSMGVHAGVLAHVVSSSLAGLTAMVLAVRLLGLSPVRLVLPHRDVMLRIAHQFRMLLRSRGDA